MNKYGFKVLMHHGYFLATMVNMSSVEHFCCDVCLLLSSLVLFLAGLNALVAKDKISPYWEPWAADRDRWIWSDE